MNDAGSPVEERIIRTAGEPHKIILEADRKTLKADGKDLAFITATIVDEKGNVCPHADNELVASIKGNISFKTIANGDPTNLQLFHEPHMKAFSGKLVVTVQVSELKGKGELTVSGKGMSAAKIDFVIVD